MAAETRTFRERAEEIVQRNVAQHASTGWHVELAYQKVMVARTERTLEMQAAQVVQDGK